MRRKAAVMLLVAALGGCTSFQSGPESGGGNVPHWGKSHGPPTVPGLKGPYGEDIAMAAPYYVALAPNAYVARQMMNQSVPLSAVQMNNPAGGVSGMPPGTAMPRGPMLSPPGMPFAPGAPGIGAPGQAPGITAGVLPAGGVLPANMPMGGGVINANIPPGKMPGGALMQTQMAHVNPAADMRFNGQRTQIRFVRPSGMRVSWFAQGSDGRPAFSTTPLEAPGRYNFPQAAIYRLKLSNIEGRPGLEVYPTMEVVPSNPKTEAFLAHSAVPIAFTEEDFKQIAEGNYLVKVIYLPDPQFQDVAGTGTDEILSTRLEPGADPIQEALRRGSILVVLRMGNVDQEAPNTPPLNAPGPHAAAPMAAPPMMAQPGPGGMPRTGVPAPVWATKAGTPKSGVPSAPPTSRTPKALPGTVEAAVPREPLLPPGALSTNTSQNDSAVVPAVPAFPPTAPMGPQLTPPARPQSTGPASPAPATSRE